MINRKAILILFFLAVILIRSQEKEFVPLVKVIYKANLKLGENYNKEQTFVLCGNTKDYYFGGYRNYLKDTGQDDDVPKKSGITLSIADYFEERVLRKDGITNVFGLYRDERLRYEENFVCRWVLYSETKIINGVKCQMAATNKYGRRWIAYFSIEHQIPIGPYKFTGLPGLIFEIYDTKDDYHFTLIKLEKYTDDFEFNMKGYKKFSKKDFLKASFNLEFTTAGFPMEGDMSKELEQALSKRRKMYNNPLELKPFE